MATGLLGGVLPYIYSRADALKRTLGDVVSNPMASTEQAVNYANDRARYLNQLNAQVSSQGLKGLMSPQGQELANLYTEAYNPVGMTTKSVSPKIGINVNQGGSSFADKIISGEKKFETRESDSLRAYVGKRVGIIRTGEGKAKAIGDVTLGEPIVVSSPEEFAKLRDLHLVPEGSKFDIKQGGVKYLYPIENPVPYGVEKDVAKYGIVSRKILGEPDTLEKALYPQQAALDLAQQRAALPVEQGGLGLPANNTAMDRAKAMGFDVDAYRGTTGDIESSVIPSDFFGSNYFGKGINLTTSPKDASKYASTDVGVNTDLVGKAELMSKRLDISYPEAKAQLTSGGGTVIPITANINNPLVIGAQKIQAPESVIRYALNESGYSGDIEKLVKQFKGANTGFEQFELIKSKQATPFYQNLSSLMNKNGLMIDESLSPKSEGGMHYVASSPEQIRSRFAAFDPFRKDVATATAMGVALPDLLAQPVNQYQPTYETITMYTDPFGNTIGSSIR